MKYVSTLLAVRNMARSRQFYHDVLGLNVTADFGANVVLEGVKTCGWRQVPEYAGSCGRSVSRGQIPALYSPFLPQCVFRRSSF